MFRKFAPAGLFVILIASALSFAGLRHADAALLVQSATGTKPSNGATPTSVSATYSAAATAGNMLIAVVGGNGTATITGPAGWSTAINQSGNASQAIFYKRAAGGETVVTATVNSNPGSLGIHIYEYSGATTLMQTGSASGNSATPASGSVTTTVSNELVLAAFTIADLHTSVTDTSWANGAEGFAEHNDFWTDTIGNRDGTYAGGDNLTNTAGARTVTVAAGSAQWRGQIVRFQNDTTAPAAVSSLALSNPTVSSITLTWTAPGDDGTTGTAASYDIRYSTSPIASDAAFTAATQVSGEPTPTAAGTSQNMTVSGLSPGTLYYFAMKTSDEIPNVSGLSNVPSLSTSSPPDTTAPAAVSNLALSNPTVSSITLTWTAPGDDGTTGTAASYDIRRSSAPIVTEGDWGAATQLTGEPTPLSAGSIQTMTASGLSAGTTYYFAMKTSDEVPNTSALSNSPGLATLPPPDTTAPAAISNLSLSSPTTSSIVLTWTAPGDDGTSGTASLYDVHYSTSPILSDADYTAAMDATPSPPAPQSAGTVQTMTATGLSASTTYYFAIKTYDEVPNVSALSNSPGLSTLTPPDTTPPAAVTDLALSNPTTSSIVLTWTAPGDDGTTGTAASYDIRYSTSPIANGQFATATEVTGEPAPAVAGTSQGMTVSGLSAGTTYYFAMKTTDDAPNTSALSNVPSLSTLTPPDTTPPDAVTNLAASSPTTNSIVLTWTAPGDDGASGTAASYDIRYSAEYSINTDGIWNGATQVTGEPAPLAAGTVQSMTVTGLSPNTNYNFAIKTVDDAPNTSGLSNSPSRSTLPLPDTTAPAAVSTLAASSPTTSSIVLTWTATGDDGTSGTASYYDIHYSTSPILSDADFNAGTHVSGEPAPLVSGTVQTVTVAGLSASTTYYFAMKVADEIPNTSALSNSPSLATLPSPDTTAPAAVSTLALSGATDSSITLTWTAPGDDGASGTAASYDIRYSTSPIANGQFATAAQVTGEPTPLSSGNAQTMTVTGLSSGTTYYFAMKTSDEVPNVSALSNVPSLSTTVPPDTTPPAAVSNLFASGQTETSIVLTWTAPGDDGSTGTAAAYDIRYSTSSIATNADFTAATAVSGPPAPTAAGTVQTMTVTGLSSGTTYFFALKSADEVPNVSPLSNVPTLATLTPGAPPPQDAGGGSGVIEPVDTELGTYPEACTPSRNIALSVHAHNAIQIKISNLSDLSDAEWKTYSADIDTVAKLDWTLSEGDGDKKIYVKFRSPYGFDSETKSVSIKLDRAGNCMTPHAHVVTPDGKVMAVGTEDACKSDYAHAEIVPYLVDMSGPERGEKDFATRIDTISPIETHYNFGEREDVVLHVERIGSTRVYLHAEQVATGHHHSIRLRIATDFGPIDDILLWKDSRELLPRSFVIDLEKYAGLCRPEQVPHAHAGDLFKSPTSEIYYMGKDRKRYSFPNDDVFKSWYPKGADIEIVPGYTLAHASLGGNVTYRPGSIVNIIGESIAYAVDGGKKLRTVASDGLAETLFGAAWKGLVRGLDIALVPDYTFGAAINFASDFLGTLKEASSATIETR